jgi:tetrapyrrole methylase family protein/MazG family protein
MNKNTLIIVGSGIKFMSHLTVEAKACIEKADKVLYLINEPVTQEWIKNANPSAESLDPLYLKNLYRNDNYLLISKYIIENLEKYQTLCVVIYGHPTVFVQPSLFAAKHAKEEGYNVVIMPGISSEDCLFADLLIDPGSFGCYSVEATDFLIYCREYDPRSHLILWQPYVIGLLSRPVNHNPSKGLAILVEYLNEKYLPDHEVILYEAAQYPSFKPRIESIVLKNLPTAKVTPLTTLYIPPVKQDKPNVDVIEKLRAVIEN